MKTGSTPAGWVKEQVDSALAAFLGRQRDTLLTAGEDLAPVADTAAGLLGGGKRLRPAFCYWGWRGAGGADTPGIVTAAASLELLHAGALVHDDLIDFSDTRRGAPSVHQQFAARHAAHGWRGPAGAFGTGAAILLGDLLFSWAGEMYQGSGLAAAALCRGQPVLDRMRTEVFTGQYLDLLEQSAGQGTVASALRVSEYKTAKYTIERPLQLGAALAGVVDGPVPAAYARYGLPLGIAFQLRDDILGVFGDPALTGKPAGDDLREGKHTVLLALTRQKATARQAAVVDRHLGDPLLGEAGTAAVRSVIAATGALAECEEMIERHVSQAVAALAGAPVTGEARQALADLAVAATARAA